jgi:putative ABC transport system permease protein
MISVTRATATPGAYQSPETWRKVVAAGDTHAPMAALLRLAARQLRAHGARAALTLGGVAVGVALVVAIRVVNASTLAAFTDAIEDLAGTAALQVRGAGPFPEAVADRLREVPGVERAVPIVTATFFGVDPPLAGEALAVFAADVSDAHAVRTLRLVRTGERVVDDPLGFLVDPTSIIVPDVLAARLGIGRDARLRLRTPGGIRAFTVRGVLPPGGVGRAFGGNLVLMDVVGAQVVLGRDATIDQVDLTLEPGVTVEAAEPRVRAALDPGLEAIRPARRGEQIERYLDSYQTLLSGISGLALLAAVFLIGSAVATSVAARRPEIGLLRAVGARRREVLGVFVAEALLLGVAGTALGIPGGLVLARLLLAPMTESAALVFSMTMFTSGLEVTTSTLALGAATGILAALLAGWAPARAAVGVTPLAATRAPTVAPVARHWPARGSVTVALGVTGAALWAEVRFASATAGNVAALAADFAVVCLVMRHAGTAARLVLRPWRPRLGFAGRLAVDRLVRLPDQLALAAGVLALGLGLMVLSATLARSFETSVLDFIRRQVRADLVVASGATTGWVEAPVDERLGERLAALPGVATIERLRLVDAEFRGSRISVDSLDATAFAAERCDDFAFAAGDPPTALAAVRAGGAVLVSRNFARHFDVGVGTTLRLDAPAGPLVVPVAGVVVDYVSPRGSVVMTRDLYQRFWPDRGVTRFHLTLAPGATPERVRAAIAADVGGAEGLKVLTQRELWAYHQDAVRRAFRFTRALEVLPLLVAALGLAEALLAVSLDRRREFGLLRAAGATRAQVARTVLVEAAGVGTLGFAGGVLTGLALSLLWVRVNFAHQLGWEIEFHFAVGSLPAAALAALGVSLPAGLLPARRVARLPPLAALREG